MGKKEVVLGGAVLDLWVGLEWAVLEEVAWGVCLCERQRRGLLQWRLGQHHLWLCDIGQVT